MEKHIKTVAWIHIAIASLTILFKILGALRMAGGGIIGGIKTFNLFAVILSPVAALLWLIFAVAFSLLALLGGRGLLNRERWSRPLMLVIGALLVLSFPVGFFPFGLARAALGIYTIWVLWNAKSDGYFVKYMRLSD